MSSKRLTIVAAGVLGACCACNTANQNIGDEDPAFGEAVKYNAAVQTINPDPVYAAGAAQPGDNGDEGRGGRQALPHRRGQAGRGHADHDRRRRVGRLGGPR